MLSATLLMSTLAATAPEVDAPSALAGAKAPLAARTEQGASGGAALAALALLAAGAAGLALSRRRARTARVVQILETAPVAPRRALVVARVGSETLLLGSSEAGLSLLTILRPDEQLQAVADRAAAGLDQVADSRQKRGPTWLSGLFARPEAPQPTFEQLLAEPSEDAELRRKLAAGVAGRVS